jgi:hypothetical protein
MVECVLKLLAWDSFIAAGKRDVAKRERAALSSLPVCTQRKSNRPTVFWSQLLDVVSTSRSLFEWVPRCNWRGSRRAQKLMRMESSSKAMRVGFCNGADRELWKIFSHVLRQLVQRRTYLHCDVAAQI